MLGHLYFCLRLRLHDKVISCYVSIYNVFYSFASLYIYIYAHYTHEYCVFQTSTSDVHWRHNPVAFWLGTYIMYTYTHTVIVYKYICIYIYIFIIYTHTDLLKLLSSPIFVGDFPLFPFLLNPNLCHQHQRGKKRVPGTRWSPWIFRGGSARGQEWIRLGDL